ncbi:unconventional myosin-IXb-like [Protopterus annectens]|uniref:unconventional myosin-IXb-like n=1 Tax=Protopterus annectens TaxID=7888 RepID=UPI001CFAD1BB|nr:unconventional myosin-IXb-like [Protopterus annectens]
MEKILSYIEERGLQTEGIYRKCGETATMKILQQCIEEDRPKEEQLTALYKATAKLPPENYKTLQRLISHLVKVALLEDSNKMSPNALAVIFTPCILHAESDEPLTSMDDIFKAIINS